MVKDQKDMKIPTELIPHCPRCGELMTMNLRIDGTFVQDEGWYAAQDRYATFIESYRDKKIIPFEIHKNTVSFNDDIKKVLNDLLA